MIKVLIVDDQDIIREGLKLLLSNNDDMEIVETASNGREAINICRSKRVDVILMDIRMPELDGVKATEIIKKEYQNIKIIILTTFHDDEYIFDSLKYGATGYLLKDAPPAKISEAIRAAYVGGALIQPDIASKVIDRFISLQDGVSKNSNIDNYDLSQREKDILRLLANGLNNKEMAEELFISEGTVKNHITNVLSKLELRDRTQLALFAVKNGL